MFKIPDVQVISEDLWRSKFRIWNLEIIHFVKIKSFVYNSFFKNYNLSN